MFLLRSLSKSFSKQNKIFSEKVISINNSEVKPNLLIIHGILGSTKLYKFLAQYSDTKANFNSYLIDLPNHGKSLRTNQGSIPSMAIQVANWIKEQKYNNDLTVVGHSLGGRVIMSMTSQYPQLQQKIKKIIILDASPVSYIGYPFHQKSLNLFKKLQNVDFSQSQESVQTQIRSLSETQVQYQMLLKSVDFQNKCWQFNIKSIRQNYQKMLSFNLSQPTQWDSEILVLRGIQSPFIRDIDQILFHKLYKNVNMQKVNCGHNIHLQKPLHVLKTINKI